MSRDNEISEPVIVVAMESITQLVDMASQRDIHLADSRDRVTVMEALEKLHRAGYELEPPEMAAWARSNGWRPEAAARLRDYAERICEGKTQRRPKGHTRRVERLRPDIAKQWQNEAYGDG
jgi:hypothetical protein